MARPPRAQAQAPEQWLPAHVDERSDGLENRRAGRGRSSLGCCAARSGAASVTVRTRGFRRRPRSSAPPAGAGMRQALIRVAWMSWAETEYLALRDDAAQSQGCGLLQGVNLSVSTGAKHQQRIWRPRARARRG